MTNYEALKKKAERLESQLRYGIAYRANLEHGVIVAGAQVNGPYSGGTGQPFRPHLSNRTAASYGCIDTDNFNEEEMNLLKTIVNSYVGRIEKEYLEAVAKLEAIEELLS